MSSDLPLIREALRGLLLGRRFHDVQNLVREIEDLAGRGCLQHTFALAMADTLLPLAPRLVKEEAA